MPEAAIKRLDPLAVICLGAEHGASKQEILDLQWTDIDFDARGGAGFVFTGPRTAENGQSI